MSFKWLSPLLNADGDIGASSDLGDSETSSVETDVETSDTGIDPESVTEENTPDVSQQASFASRLKQESEKIEQQYQPHKQRSERFEQLAKAEGFSNVDDYFDDLDRQAKERKAEEEAYRLGLDPETYNQHFAPVKNELSQTKQELARLQQSDIERQIKADYERLSAQYPDFKDHEDAVWAMATERRLPLEDAYKLVSYDSRIAAARQETEQQVLANITSRDQKQVLSGKDQGANTAIDPSNMSLSDIASISARVQRGERITF
ncbi:hypothetical protein [Paenibacillus sp. L3-i20]|uniref:hypothetical protein n=1 Tax=Paenibacillus sp. L3-i20 TaxID=2905833 RepID=UPI001EDEA55F|nr:hypothetical protein [Paenibacillus sp. L3-i20]GKU76848.1 hypothetical protein L3i20_v212450 [Paenibacillus sp. L3-i20]